MRRVRKVEDKHRRRASPQGTGYITRVQTRAVNDMLGEKKSVLSPSQKSPILSHPERGDRNFSQEGRFWLTKNRGAKQKKTRKP